MQEVLADACKPYPRLQAKLFNPDRHLSARVLVYANHTDIRLLQHEQTPVDADTEMKLVVALCGG